MATATALDLPTRLFAGQDRLKGAFPPELIAPNYRADIVGFPSMDAAGHAQFGAAFYSAFPDLVHTIDQVISTDAGYAVRWTVRGTHRGPLMGIPATGRSIEVSAIVLLTVTDGRVEHLRAIFDQMGMMRQLGVIPT